MSERILTDAERQALLLFLYSDMTRREGVGANANQVLIEKLRAITKLFEGTGVQVVIGR
jgi:hypothetical protein